MRVIPDKEQVPSITAHVSAHTYALNPQEQEYLEDATYVLPLCVASQTDHNCPIVHSKMFSGPVQGGGRARRWGVRGGTEEV